MVSGFPTNTVVLIIATMIGAGAGSWFMLSQALSQLPVAPHIRRTWRWGTALILLSWFLARLAFAAYPAGEAVLGTQFLITFTFLGVGLLAGLLPLLISPTFRQLVRTMPQAWLVGIHAIRLAGFLFLALMDMHLLPAAFALPAGYGDITVALLALGLVYLMVQRNPYVRALAIGWNVLGLLDFVSALTTGGLYILPFAAQAAASGMALDYLNYVLIVPAFGVPLYAVLHVYSLFQLASAREDRTQQDVKAPAQAPVSPREQHAVHS